MLFPEEDAPYLKNWIVKRLENTSDADPDVLADYVLALLRHDGDINDVRKLCEDEIPDFLKEDSPVFVSDVFNVIAYRSYLPGAPPPPPRHAAATQQQQQQASGLYYDDGSAGAPQPFPPRPQNGSKKRAYTDWDDPNAQIGGDAGPGRRSFKQPRRGGRGPRPEETSHARGVAPGVPGTFPSAAQLPRAPGLPGPTTVGFFDPRGAMDAVFGMSLAASHPMPEFSPYDRGRPLRKRKKCRDWEKKGYCQRGSNCNFEHSTDGVYPPLPAGLQFTGMPALPLPQPAGAEEYDPTNALMADLSNGMGPLQGQMSFPDFSQQQPRQRGGKQQNRQRRGERAHFSAEGAVYDRTKTTIVVENIPEQSFSEEDVKGFFSQFGNILEVSMQPYKRLAIVKFDTWNAANAAYQSPKVIFDNRFVRVFWFKDDESALPASAPMNGDVPAAARMQAMNGSDAGPHAELDMEEFTKQQEEKQKAFEEKTKRREELEQQREELEKRQKELIAKQMEEKAKLEAKLHGSRNGTKSEENEDGSKMPKPVTQTEALRAQLAALEAEARQMGLDPDAVDAPSPWPARGGYGRGRGAWRGSSPYTPRGSFRGGYRGRANVHAAYAAYSLDNRPKKVVLSGVDFTVSEKDETLRQYLFGIGEFTDIQTTQASTEITFKDRKTAEKFFNSVLLNGKEIPGLDASPVEVSWPGANGASASAPTTPGSFFSNDTTNPKPTATPHSAIPSAAATRNDHLNGTTSTPTPSGGGAANGKSRDTQPAATTTSNNTTTKTAGAAAAASANDDVDEDDDESSDKDVHIMLERPPAHGHHHRHGVDQNEMDYEVADEDQWGY
ncbi:RNA-binding protein 26 [Staphylotrichum tortipilum]|uniref:RNA-binding protein 26 n=1 Tax=Staphylotrichum tortipilum TaxID=2831512 RepID=A0AAN6MPD7_9PEZI|nr:RNA-binding protein 26 [Staphylotrichum longicolle]